MVLKPCFKRKLMRWCMDKGYDEEECKNAVEMLDAKLEERIRRALREIVEGTKHEGGGEHA